MARLGYYKGHYLGDMPKGKGGKALGINTTDKAEARAMFNYLKAQGRNPSITERVVETASGRRQTRWEVK